MSPDFGKILNELDRWLAGEKNRRRKEGGPYIPKVEILLLGQMGLLAHPSDLSVKLHLVGTIDVDAKVSADRFVVKEFGRILKDHDLEYDEDSEKVWVPPKSTQTMIHDSLHLKCDVLDPIYLLTSKAIKAKEKNRFLVQEALVLFGNELEELIVRHGGDLDYFRKA